jgi:hypothetical protein
VRSESVTAARQREAEPQPGSPAADSEAPTSLRGVPGTPGREPEGLSLGWQLAASLPASPASLQVEDALNVPWCSVQRLQIQASGRAGRPRQAALPCNVQAAAC